jgi:hypothetical protein
MILPAHDFRRHVARGATGVLLIVWCPYSSDAEISQPQIPIGLENKVLWLNVSMNYSLIVNVLETQYKTGDVKLNSLLIESSVFGDVVPQVSSIQKVHHQVHVLPILKGIVHID